MFGRLVIFGLLWVDEELSAVEPVEVDVEGCGLVIRELDQWLLSLRLLVGERSFEEARRGVEDAGVDVKGGRCMSNTDGDGWV